MLSSAFSYNMHLVLFMYDLLYVLYKCQIKSNQINWDPVTNYFKLNQLCYFLQCISIWLCSVWGSPVRPQHSEVVRSSRTTPHHLQQLDAFMRHRQHLHSCPHTALEHTTHETEYRHTRKWSYRSLLNQVKVQGCFGFYQIQSAKCCTLQFDICMPRKRQELTEAGNRREK